MEKDTKAPAPPYVPYKTLKNFLERFKQGVPGRVDRGLMGSMSGAVQSQVKTALRYLNLISDNDIPSDTMKRFCTTEGEDRKQVLKQILTEAYPYIFGKDGLNFSTATGSQLREQIEAKTTASGETLNRCLSFLKDAAADAGITVSPYIKQVKSKNGAGRKKAGKPKPAEGSEDTRNDEPAHKHAQAPIPAQSSLLLWGLFQRLPKPGQQFPKSDREQWVATLTNVLAMEYKE